MASMFSHENGLNYYRHQSEGEDDSLDESDNYQTSSESSELPLYFYIFTIFAFIGLMRCRFFLVYDHGYVRGSLLVFIGSAGFSPSLLPSCFASPFFWRAEWLALSGKGNPDRCEIVRNTRRLRNPDMSELYHQSRFQTHQ